MHPGAWNLQNLEREREREREMLFFADPVIRMLDDSIRGLKRMEENL